MILPIEDKGEVVYVVEIASFNNFSESDEELIIEALKIEEKKPAKKTSSTKKTGADTENKNK